MAAAPLSLPAPYQLGRAQSEVSGLGSAPAPSELSALWFGRLAMCGARPLHRVGRLCPPETSARDHQQHPFPGVALGAGAALGLARLRTGLAATATGLAGQIPAAP